jgi:hypothetical protein
VSYGGVHEYIMHRRRIDLPLLQGIGFIKEVVDLLQPMLGDWID